MKETDRIDSEEDKILGTLDKRKYTRSHMIIAILIALFLPNAMWGYVTYFTGGKISKPKTEEQIALECIYRVADSDMDDFNARVALYACFPK